MSAPEIVLLDGQKRFFRAAILKTSGYRVFTTEHVVEVCLHWMRGSCAALVIGPQIQVQHVETLCDWIKINNPEKAIVVLASPGAVRWPATIDAVVPSQPVQALLERLQSLVPWADREHGRVKPTAIRHVSNLYIAGRLRNVCR